MAQTDFGSMSGATKNVWSRDVVKAARDMMFITRFLGKSGTQNVIQRITELTKTEKGTSCVIQLVADLIGDGQAGDDEREGMEEALKNYVQTINIDQMSNGVKNTGKLSDQATVINWREEAKDALAYWLANRLDQLAFLTLSGISYAYKNDGGLRSDATFQRYSFAADVTAPSSKRHLMFNGTSLVPSVTANITSSFTPKYKMLVQAVAYAKTHYIKPIMSGGKEYFVLFVHPMTLAMLKQDSDWLTAVVNAGVRGNDNPWFTGATVTVDGLVIHEHRLVYNTTGTTTKWGSGNLVEGSRSLLCGSQALAMADLGAPEWDEKSFQYGNVHGINIDKMMGFLKPQFHSIYDNSTQDFGVLALDHYIN